MKQIKASHIENQFLACPYCMAEVSIDQWRGCCGESSAHFSEALETLEGEVYLLSEVDVLDDLQDLQNKGVSK